MRATGRASFVSFVIPWSSAPLGHAHIHCPKHTCTLTTTERGGPACARLPAEAYLVQAEAYRTGGYVRVPECDWLANTSCHMRPHSCQVATGMCVRCVQYQSATGAIRQTSMRLVCVLRAEAYLVQAEAYRTASGRGLPYSGRGLPYCPCRCACTCACTHTSTQARMRMYMYVHMRTYARVMRCEHDSGNNNDHHARWVRTNEATCDARDEQS